jgi:hypothetical protein
MKKATPFKLQCSDIDEYWSGHYAKLKGSTIRLVHRPTGLDVSGDVPQVHQTKASLQRAQDVLRIELMRQLTDLVAKQLRLPGR